MSRSKLQGRALRDHLMSKYVWPEVERVEKKPRKAKMQPDQRSNRTEEATEPKK